MKKITNAIVIDTCTQRIAALRKHVSPKAEIVLGGERFKLADLITIFESCLATRGVVVAKQAEYKAAVAQKEEAEKRRQSIEGRLKTWVVNLFGDGSQTSHEFGYRPRKKPEVSAENRVEAIKRAQATRKARHTMGPKEKQKVKGTVVVLVDPEKPGSTVAASAGDAKPAAAPQGA